MSRNPVKKNMDKVTKPATHRDRKKDLKRGHEKHKGKDALSPTKSMKTAPTAPQEPTHAYLDLDSVIFQAASAGEQVWYVYKDRSGKEVAKFDSAAAGKNWLDEIETFGMDMEYGYEGSIEDLTRTTEYEIKDFKHCKKSFDNVVKEWVELSRCKNWTGYVSKATGKPNFRHKLATLKEYKGSRKSTRKPHYLEEVRSYAMKHPNVKKSIGEVETDDYIVLMAERKGEKGCAVSVDKDTRQCSGCWVLIIDQDEEPVFNDPTIIGTLENIDGKKVTGSGYLFLLWQLVNGDSVDGIGGVKRWGLTKAYDLLSEFSGQSIDRLDEAVSKVADVYKEVYNDSHSYKHHTSGETIQSSWKEILEENLRLLWMLRYKGDRGEVITKCIRDDK